MKKKHSKHQDPCLTHKNQEEEEFGQKNGENKETGKNYKGKRSQIEETI